MVRASSAGTNEDQLLTILRERLYVAVISDILDKAGLHDQVMDVRLRPLAPNMRLIGRAHTVLTADIYERQADPYRLEIEAVDSLKAGDIMVASTGHSVRTSFWGELLSTAALARGAAGCVVDGFVRDALKIIEMDFPVFTTGLRPVDSSYRSMVIQYGCPVDCGGVIVQPGDIIFGDYDGIIVIPADHLEATVTAALAKVESENNSRQMLLDGALLRDVYDRYGVL